MKFRDAVRAANQELEHIPAGFKRYGSVMVLRSNHLLSDRLGETILSIYPWCTSVYQHQTTTGQSRIPQLRHLAGEDDPVVVHRENGVTYTVDLSRITFSGGNRHLREQLVDLVDDGEYLLDMFAAVGNLSLQPLVHRNIEALLIERNPYTFSFLQKNLELNNIPPSLALNTDCRSLDRTDFATRIFMGYHEVDHSHLKVAVAAARSQAFIHLHPLVSKDNWDEASTSYSDIFDQLGIRSQLVLSHAIKDYAPGVEHVELVYQIFK